MSNPREVDGVKIFGMSVKFLVAVVLFLIHPGLALGYVIWMGTKCARADRPMRRDQLQAMLDRQDRDREAADELIARQQRAINGYLRRPA